MSDVSSSYYSSEIYSKYGVNAANSSSKSDDSKNASIEDTFMELLLAELQHQNPMEPMDSSAMVSQMAQMNTVQQLQDIAESIGAVDKSNKFLTASSLIGKQVAYLTEELYGEGIVSAYSVDGDTVNLLVNDQSISIEDIIGVSGVQATEE